MICLDWEGTHDETFIEQEHCVKPYRLGKAVEDDHINVCPFLPISFAFWVIISNITTTSTRQSLSLRAISIECTGYLYIHYLATISLSELIISLQLCHSYS